MVVLEDVEGGVFCGEFDGFGEFGKGTAYGGGIFFGEGVDGFFVGFGDGEEVSF